MVIESIQESRCYSSLQKFILLFKGKQKIKSLLKFLEKIKKKSFYKWFWIFDDGFYDDHISDP